MPADAAPAWLHVPGLGAAGDSVAFTAWDLHYLTRVCRARAGDRVTATDGRGRVATIRLAAGGGGLAGTVESVEARARTKVARVLCGAPEDGRGDWLIEKLAELGVAVFQPVDCERGGWERAARRRERWERLAVAALRQSQSAFRLEIAAPAALDAAVAGLPAGGTRWLADPAGPKGAAGGAGAEAAAAIGPAAGFSDAERARLREAGFEPIGLSGNRLRTETAAVAWAAWWAAG